MRKPRILNAESSRVCCRSHRAASKDDSVSLPPGLTLIPSVVVRADRIARHRTVQFLLACW